MKLTEKQKRFADYYIETGNATESARLAGYKQPHVQGSQCLEKLSVKTYIDKQLNKLADKRIMKAQEALELLTAIGRGEMTEELYIPTENGIERIEKKPDIKDRQKAIESILKRYPTNRHDELKEKLLEAQIDKTKAETDKLAKDDQEGDEEIIIVDRWSDEDD